MGDSAAAPAEFSRSIDVRQVKGKHMVLTANEAERAALSARFGLVRVDRLEAHVTLHRDDRNVTAEGSLSADITQSCAVSAEDLAVEINEPLHLRFIPAGTAPVSEDEIEIDSAETDEIEYVGTHIDVGEAVAQTLALAIDPFLTGPDADEARRAAGLLGESQAGPFAALAALKKHGD